MPVTGAPSYSGYNVLPVDPRTGTMSGFNVNAGDAPAGIFEPNHFNKPIDVKFQERSMQIVIVDGNLESISASGATTASNSTIVNSFTNSGIVTPAPQPPDLPTNDGGANLFANAFNSLVGEVRDLLRPDQLNHDGTGPAAPELAAVLAAAQHTDTFVALLGPASNSGVQGAALVQFDQANGDVTIAVRASGLTPDQMHLQHIADQNDNLSFVQTFNFDLDNPQDASIFHALEDRVAGRLFEIHGLELAPGHGEGNNVVDVDGSGGHIPDLAVANGVLLPVNLVAHLLAA